MLAAAAEDSFVAILSTPVYPPTKQYPTSKLIEHRVAFGTHGLRKIQNIERVKAAFFSNATLFEDFFKAMAYAHKLELKKKTTKGIVSISCKGLTWDEIESGRRYGES